MRQAIRHLIFASFLLSSLAACERLGIADPAKEAAARDAEGRAIGGACRQSGRALEDCYTLNQGALKSAVFEGWREMNDYMMQNKLEAVKPEFPVPGVLVSKRKPDADAAPEHGSEAAASEPSDENMSAADRRRARLAERRKRAAEASGPAAEATKSETKGKAAAH